MRQLFVILLLASVHSSSISAAPTATIGIYRDPGAMTSCGSSLSQIFDIYVYLLLPDNPNGVSRVPFRVERQLSANTFIMGWFPVQGSVDLGDAEYLNHEIVFSEPRFGRISGSTSSSPGVVGSRQAPEGCGPDCGPAQLPLVAGAVRRALGTTR